MIKLNMPLLIPAATAEGATSGLTMTLKFCVALRFGVPLSVTTTLNGFVVLAWVTDGRQVRMPLVALMVALVGASGKLKVSVCAGTSASVAWLVMDRFTPALMVTSETGAKTGAKLETGVTEANEVPRRNSSAV